MFYYATTQVESRTYWISVQCGRTFSITQSNSCFLFLAYTNTFLIGERAKRARHSQVCSIENRGYIYYNIYIIVRANFVLITRKEGGA